MTAMVRNLAKMTRVGLLGPGSAGPRASWRGWATRPSARRGCTRSPSCCAADLRGGRGARAAASWTPVAQVVDALDAAFYTAFANVEPAGKRLLLALDVSGSMRAGSVAGPWDSLRATPPRRWPWSRRRPRAGTRSSASSPARTAAERPASMGGACHHGLTPVAIPRGATRRRRPGRHRPADRRHRPGSSRSDSDAVPPCGSLCPGRARQLHPADRPARWLVSEHDSV